MSRILRLEVEADIDWSELDELKAGYRWQGEGDLEGVSVEVQGQGGHGFGLTELLDVVVVISGGVAVDLVVDAIKAAVKGTIRRVRDNCALPGEASHDEPTDLESAVHESWDRGLDSPDAPESPVRDPEPHLEDPE